MLQVPGRGGGQLVTKLIVLMLQIRQRLFEAGLGRLQRGDLIIMAISERGLLMAEPAGRMQRKHKLEMHTFRIASSYISLSDLEPVMVSFNFFDTQINSFLRSSSILFCMCENLRWVSSFFSLSVLWSSS